MFAAFLVLAGSVVADDEKLLGDTLPEDVELELELALNSESENNIDLNSAEDADVGVSEAEVTVTLVYEPSDEISGELGLTLLNESYFVDDLDEEESETELEVDKLLWTFREIPVEDAEIQVGRQKYRDNERRFLFDRTLDGLRFFHTADALAVEASFGREQTFRKNLLDDDDSRAKVNYYALLVDHTFSDSVRSGGYLLFVDDRSEDDELALLGVRSFGSFDEDWTYWADVSHARGFEGGNDISGFAVDTVATFRFEEDDEFSLTIGYAWGSGDSDPDDGTDNTYRQSGIQGNEAAFNGIERFKYLGEALDPELRNLHVFTAGVGATYEGASIDVVYHHYRLDEFAEELGDARIEADFDDSMNGKFVGDELDLILAFEDVADVPDFEILFALGYFWSGSVYASENDNDAYVLRLDMALAF